MSDDLSKVDWGKPIEAVGPRGQIVRQKLDPTRYSPDAEGDYVTLEEGDAPFVWDANGIPWNSVEREEGWRLRNVAEVSRNPEAPSDVITLTADQVAMLRKVLTVIGDAQPGYQTFFVSAQVVQDARDALALLPKPVDADLVEARKLAVEHTDGWGERRAADILAGLCDDGIAVPAMLAAIRRGRALERDSREG